MNENKKLLIPLDLVQALHDYLIQRPMVEVELLAIALRKLEKADE